MVSSPDDYLHAKNLGYQLIPSRDPTDQRVLQSDWTSDLCRHQAFTNCVHGYDRARNVHVTALRVHENSCTVLIPLCKNNLNLPISHTDHYALRK